MIPKGWIEKNVCEVCDVYQPQTISGKELVSDGKYKVYGANGIIGFYDKFNHAESEVLLGCRGSCGAVNMSCPEAWINGNAMVVRPKQNKILKQFLKYFLLSCDFSNYISGTATPQITRKSLSPLKIYYPGSISEQQQIVDMLDTLFADIEKEKQIAEHNLQIIRELFESVADKIFEQPHQDWIITTLGDISTQKQSKKEITCTDEDMVTFAPMEYLGIGTKYLNTNLVRKFGEVKSGYTYFAENDVLMAKITPCFENGKIGIAKNLVNGIGFGSSEYIVFRPDKNINRDFLYYFLNRQSFRKKGAKRMLGAAGHKRVAKDFIDTYVFQYPADVDIQTQIVHKLDILQEQTRQMKQIYTQQIADLDELKQSILKKAFNGEL